MRREHIWLVITAAIGLLVPGALFMFWLIHDYVSLSAALSDRLALESTLAFGIAAFVGLNWFFAPAPRPSFTAWWRHV